MTDKLTFGSLFSGIGGIDLGLERAGMECKWQVEINEDCREILSKHWKGVPKFNDIKTVESLPTVDLVCGGFPCQDLSVAGKRQGLAGERSGLFFEFMRVVASVAPRWILLENVPGLLSSNGGRDMATVIGEMEKCGYWWSYRILNAQYFGVPQRRNRVFIVGRLGGKCQPEILFESESLCRYPEKSRQAGKIAPAIPASGAETSRTGNERTEADLMILHENKSGNLTGADYARALRSGASHNYQSVVARSLKASGGFKQDDTHETYIAQPLFDKSGYRANADETLVDHALTQRHDSSEDGTGRGTPLVVRTGGDFDDPSIQIDDKAFLAANPMSDRQMAIHDGNENIGVRRLTPTECERLMGFPDGWTATDSDGKPMSDSARYRMCGNAVVVPVAEWIGRRIMAAMHE